MDQRPRDALKKREVDKAGIIYSKPQLWKWIAHTDGFDLTAVYSFDDIVGVSVGLYWPLQNLYYTFITRVAPADLHRLGIGKLMRTKQLERLR
eukprot:5707052-Pleurochrysis_carterae.AAC.1